MIDGIKHIIFDLGGVILNIDYNRTRDAFEAAGVQHFDDLYSQMRQTPVFDNLETGKIGQAEFIAAMQAAAATPITAQQVLTAWDAMLIDFPIRRLQILQQLRPYYDLFLLSNTNEIHEAAFNKLLYDTHGIPNLGVFFDKTYFSQRVGLRKPNKEIFELVLHENGLKPAETLFIDDSPQHIESAKEIGIVTIYLEKGMTIEKDVFKPKNAQL